MTKKSLLTTVVILLATFIFSGSQVIANQKVTESQIVEQIIETAINMGVEPEIALGIAKKESNFCQERRSSAGAVGVFQLMPSTARRIGYNPYQYKENIKGGIAYYKQLKQIFKTDELALAAYNAGPGVVKRCGGMPPYAETKRFVRLVMAYSNEFKTNADSDVAKKVAANKQKREMIAAEKEHREMITLFMLNQAI
ncbi:MAG: lytic transglycosylase domain-containing protein [Candidatus Gastranaerophilaceae bacterium]